MSIHSQSVCLYHHRHYVKLEHRRKRKSYVLTSLYLFKFITEAMEFVIPTCPKDWVVSTKS